jgi:protein gp37
MSDLTNIQWCDSTVNTIMGCGGCELYLPPGKVLGAIDQAVAACGISIDSRAIYKQLINDAYAKIPKPLPGHKNAVNTTNIWHLRQLFLCLLEKKHGLIAKDAAEKAIRQAVTCYAAILHLNKAQNLLKPAYPGNIGYAPIFEMVTEYSGRAMKAANLKDLLGLYNPQTPWKDGLPRMIFVSDMGDALSSKGDFAFLKSDLIPAITSNAGKKHLWLWLSKRPEHMAAFAGQIGGLPENVCAMTTLTGPDPECLRRLATLKQVNAHMRGLSIEPLRDRIPPSMLDLTGIDWVIVGGESGAGLQHTRPFAVEWAEELRDHCRANGVAFFLKQLGRNPSRNGKVFRLQNAHGGNWDEWPDKALKIREFPKAFHTYRRHEMKPLKALRPASVK